MRLFGIDGEIVGVEWRSGDGTVGIIAVDYKEYWVAYIGPAKYHSESEDIIAIAQNGAKLLQREAQGFFPDLDPQRYKYQ